MTRSALALLAFILLSTHALAIEIDGKLDDAEWQQAQERSLPYTVEPFSDLPPEHDTVVKIVSDESGLYFGFRNQQAREDQRSARVPRDNDLNGDVNQIILDFDNTKVSAYGFEVGNGGSILDGIWNDERNFSTDWDGNWQAATTSDEAYWYSEIFIPWNVAPMAKADGEMRELGIYLGRKVAYLNKKYASSPLDNDQTRFLSEFSSVSVKNVSTASLKTFVSFTAHEDFLQHENAVDASVELFWQPDSSKQISLTLNPDFGQVESDDLVVNFSPDEVFFNEKRPFFTENQSLFTVNGPADLKTIHTRRVGGPQDGTDELANIDAALKFTANTSGLNYGFFVVAEEDYSLADGRSVYVGRVEKQSKKFRLGLLSSVTKRPILDRKAVSHTVDYDINFSQELALRGQFSHASSTGEKELGGAVFDESDNAGWARLEHSIDSSWSQEFEYAHFGEAFEINDLGYLPRNNLKRYRYATRMQRAGTENSVVSDKEWKLRFEHAENTRGADLKSYMHLDHNLDFSNSSGIRFWARYELGNTYDDRITRGNNVVKKDDGYFFGYYFLGKERKKIRYHHMLELIDLPTDGKGYHAHIHPTFYLNDHFSMVWGLHYHYRDDWLLWQQGNELNTYTRDQLENYIDVNAHLSEKQEIRLKFQWISLSAAGNRAFVAQENGELIPQTAEVDDFSLSDTAIQIRYTYKLGPLSNIYLVYSRGGRAEADETRNPFSQFSNAWGERTGDNLLFKIRYAL